MSYDRWKAGDNGDNYPGGDGSARVSEATVAAHEARLRGEDDPRIARALDLAERVKQQQKPVPVKVRPSRREGAA